MKTLLGLGAGVGLAAGAYALLLRPRMLRWGATDEELRARARGEEIIPGGKRGAVMATTLDAPPSAVWPWLVQMGFDRAGWYSWDLLDRLGFGSARRIHPEWQALSVGERLASTPGGEHWFEVAALEPGRHLALRATMSGHRQVDSAGGRPPKFNDALWDFQLDPLPGDRTRLVVRVYAASRPRLLNAALSYLFWEPAHFIMQARQFGNLERRVRGEIRAFRPPSLRASPAGESLPRQ